MDKSSQGYVSQGYVIFRFTNILYKGSYFEVFFKFLTEKTDNFLLKYERSMRKRSYLCIDLRRYCYLENPDFLRLKTRDAEPIRIWYPLLCTWLHLCWYCPYTPNIFYEHLFLQHFIQIYFQEFPFGFAYEFSCFSIIYFCNNINLSSIMIFNFCFANENMSLQCRTNILNIHG